MAVPDGPSTVVVTSSHPGEGKTTVALGLARTQAMSGRKILLIDADTRKPNVHNVLGAENEDGLADYLSEKCDEPSIFNDEDTGLHFITAGEPVADPLPLLDSKRMEKCRLPMVSRLGRRRAWFPFCLGKPYFLKYSYR